GRLFPEKRLSIEPERLRIRYDDDPMTSPAGLVSPYRAEDESAPFFAKSRKRPFGRAFRKLRERREPVEIDPNPKAPRPGQTKSQESFEPGLCSAFRFSMVRELHLLGRPPA